MINEQCFEISISKRRGEQCLTVEFFFISLLHSEKKNSDMMNLYEIYKHKQAPNEQLKWA